MAEIDPIIAKILLKGDDEFLNSLKKVGDDGAEQITKLGEAVENGTKGQFEALAGAIGIVEGAVSAAAAAMIVFIEQQTELTQKTELLADAFGVTAGQLQSLEAIFAASGVSVQQFEQFANRLTITIAREWPQIAESIRTYANENDAAQLRVTTAILKVQDAEKALGDHSAERASQMQRDNNAVEASYLKLQFAAAHAASEQAAAAQTVRGAELSSLAAVQHLAELEGRPPSSAEKQNLAIAQAQQAVDQARRAEADARIAQQEKAAGAALKQRQIEQEYDDLARKAAKNARDDAEQAQKDQNAVKEAIIARGEAEERVTKFALTNSESIKKALDEVTTGNKNVKTSIDLSLVSIDNLTKGIIAQASAAAKGGEPKPYDTLIAISKLFGQATEEQISKEQRLAIVNRLAATSMRALGVSASEILNVIEHNGAGFEDLKNKVNDFDKAVDPAVIKQFRGALADLNLTISQLSQRFAAAAAPAFGAFLKTLDESLKSSNGVLHIMVDGFAALGRAFSTVGGLIDDFVGLIAKAFNIDKAAAWKGIVVAIGVAIAAVSSALLAWPIIIAAVVTVVGYIADNWDKVKKGAADAWKSVTDSAVVKFLESVWDVLVRIAKSIGALLVSAAKLGSLVGLGGSGKGDSGGNATEGGNVDGKAAGGMIYGPGSGTSDSILTRLSNGEFVTKAKAVAFWGADFMHAINNMQIPGFASGGLVASPIRLGGGAVTPATSTLNLSIDGRSFNGLRGPKSTIDDLSSFAIARQASAAGSNPSWMK